MSDSDDSIDVGMTNRSGKSVWAVLMASKYNGTLIVSDLKHKQRAIDIAKKHGVKPPKIYVAGGDQPKEGDTNA